MNTRPKPDSGEKVSRSSSLPSPLDWLFDYFVRRILDYLLNKLIEKVRQEGPKRVLGKVVRFVWRISPLMTIALGFVFQKEVLSVITAPYFFWLAWP